MDQEKKYVCTGECGGVSDTPGVCQDPNCSRHGQPLVEVTAEGGDEGEGHSHGEEEEK